jgi:hypothetical protein
MKKAKEDIGNLRIWISVDEATDPVGRSIANVVIGKFDGEVARSGHLVHVVELEKTDASTIVRAVQDALRILWEGALGTDDRVLFLVTDSDAYMLKAGKKLAVLYPKMIHTTCLAHGLHRVAETIGEEFPLVIKIVSAGKKIFLKAPKKS